MRIIYIDSEFKCHTSNDGTMRAVETDFFDGKCDAFLEGYRFVPNGESWRREDGVVFLGEMIAPWRSSAVLEAAQAQYEKDFAELMAEYQKGVDGAYD